MSMAMLVQDAEPIRADWLDIKADDRHVYRYRQGQNLDLDTPAHVEGRYEGGGVIRAVLVRGKDRRPVLRQDGPGLPERIVVDYIDGLTDRGAGASYW